MREGFFIRKNIEKWKKFQKEPSSYPDEMAEQFIELIDDLGYAKTYYPESRSVKYLNALTSRVYLNIYRNKKEKDSRIIQFWKTELPLIIKKHKSSLFWSMILFLAFSIIGIVSTLHDQSFVRGVLGNAYVNMTESNIEKGDPFGVYKSEDPFEMFISIALHNTKIAFQMFVWGITGGIATIYLLFKNGVMVGTFQTFFFLKDLGWQSVLVIWIHGTLEISAIIIAGGAGLILGRAVLFPGTFTRLDSIKSGVKEGIKLMFGLIPVFIAAGFLEGYVTRLTSMPVYISLSILLGSFSFIIWYFIIYPEKVFTKQIKNLKRE